MIQLNHGVPGPNQIEGFRSAQRTKATVDAKLQQMKAYDETSQDVFEGVGKVVVDAQLTPSTTSTTYGRLKPYMFGIPPVENKTVVQSVYTTGCAEFAGDKPRRLDLDETERTLTKTETQSFGITGGIRFSTGCAKSLNSFRYEEMDNGSSLYVAPCNYSPDGLSPALGSAISVPTNHGHQVVIEDSKGTLFMEDVQNTQDLDRVIADMKKASALS